jgi:hypothetical protein
MKNKSVLALCSMLAIGASVSLDAQQSATAPRVYDFQLGPDNRMTMAIETKIVKGMPYSAEVVSESVQTLSDGNRIVHRTTSRVYRDSQGRVRREEDRASGGPIITITDPVANTSITLDAATKTARETRGLPFTSGYWLGFDGGRSLFSRTLNFFDYSYGAGAALKGMSDRSTFGRTRRPEGSDYSEEHLPAKNIEGVQATGFRKTTTIPKGAIGNEQPIKIVSEEWTSNDLQVLVLTDFNDPRTGRSTYKLLNISRTEPDAALFKAPADYKVVRSFGTRTR